MAWAAFLEPCMILERLVFPPYARLEFCAPAFYRPLCPPVLSQGVSCHQYTVCTFFCLPGPRYFDWTLPVPHCVSVGSLHGHRACVPVVFSAFVYPLLLLPISLLIFVRRGSRSECFRWVPYAHGMRSRLPRVVMWFVGCRGREAGWRRMQITGYQLFEFMKD